VDVAVGIWAALVLVLLPVFAADDLRQSVFGTCVYDPFGPLFGRRIVIPEPHAAAPTDASMASVETRCRKS